MKLIVGAVAVLAASVIGCAKLPGSSTSNLTTRVSFRITLDGAVNDNFVYVVALRPSNEINPTEQGPIPVVAPPWGNGMVGGDVTHFVRWSVDQFPRYQIYEFRDVGLLDYRAIGVPVGFVDVQPGGKILEFEIDLSQIAPSVDAARAYRSLQINLLTMDRVPQGSGGFKNWDALGDGRVPSQINSPITISLRTSGIYDNARFFDLEPRGDQPDPTLDLVDFRIEVRPQ